MHEQAQILKQPTEDKTLAAVRRKPISKKYSTYGTKPHINKKTSATPMKCTRCGREPHNRLQCPAKDATCHRCNKKGHYSNQCHSKSNKLVADITSEDQDFVYLSTLRSSTNNCLCLSISINGMEVNFKVDIGAQVTAIIPSTYNLISESSKLQKPSKSLRGQDREPLTTLGMTEVTLTHQDKSSRQTV